MGNLLRAEDVGQAWLENARGWQITALPVYGQLDQDYIAANEYKYRYFSYYRPLNWVNGVDCVLIQSTEPYRDFRK